MKYSFEGNSASGVTLMEMIAALAVIAVIVVGALALYKSAESSEAATRLISDAMAVQNAVRHVYMGQSSFGYDSDELQTLMWRSKQLPTTIKATVDSAGRVSFTHFLGGEVYLFAADVRFAVLFKKIPTDVCLSMMSMTGSEWDEVTVGNADGVLNEFPAGFFPISPSDAMTYCETSDEMEIGFYSRQRSL